MYKEHKYTLDDFKNFLNSLPDDYKVAYRTKTYTWRAFANFEYMRLFWLYMKMPRKIFRDDKQVLRSHYSIETCDPKSKDIIHWDADSQQTRRILNQFGAMLITSYRYDLAKPKSRITVKDMKKAFVKSLKIILTDRINYDDLD